ncbi:GFA family protein, partial [Proteus myxofaciens]|uniref:GFA family protein n=1 Tax=Proteus myxofaciens TaxID=184072 RepID=UPI000A5F93A9
SSSEWGERGFCKCCGTHLFYHLKEADIYYVSASLFPDTKESKLTLQIYIDNKPHYYNFVEKTPMLTEQE